MTLKFKLDSLDGLDDATKALYEQKGDKFVLKVEGADDGDKAGLLAKVDQLLGEKKALQQKLGEKDLTEKEAQEAARKANEDALAKKGDIDNLRKSIEERVTTARAEEEAKWKPQVEKQNATVHKLLVDNVGQQIATKLALKGSEALLFPHVINRLAVEERDGQFVTVVRDVNGKASALSLEDLEKEFTSNAAFAPVIAGSRATGGGAGGSQNRGGGAANAKTTSRQNFDAMNQVDRMAFAKSGGTVTD